MAKSVIVSKIFASAAFLPLLMLILTRQPTVASDNFMKDNILKFSNSPLKLDDFFDDEDTYIFRTDTLPSEYEPRPTVANGHIGTVIKRDVIHMNGLYNGESNVTPSHRAVIPSTARVDVLGVQPTCNLSSEYALNSKRGFYFERHSSSVMNVTQLIYAHRTIASLLVVELGVSRSQSDHPLNVTLNVTQWGKSPDVHFVLAPGPSNLPKNVLFYTGRTLVAETNKSGLSDVEVLYDPIPKTLSLQPGESSKRWVFFTAIHPVLGTAIDHYNLGMYLWREGELLTSHTAAWEDVSKRGRVDVEGNVELSRVLSGVQYYLLSSVPLKEDPDCKFVGLSPTGLPWGTSTYWGHVFWDQETWMYPGILLLHEPLARIIINTRKRTVDAAAENARITGYKGLRYPWESAYTGVEVSPSASCAQHEVHISGDVFLAILQYWRSTNSTSFITDDGFGEIILGLADFWISRMTFNEISGLYEILDVTPPDEYHTHVNNSVFTNAVAQMTLQTAARLAVMLGRSGDVYEHYATRVYLPFDKELQYHPEYDGYKNGTQIKQADAVLLNYPLQCLMSQQVKENDLNLYAKVTSPQGPAMTWGVHAIGWLELGRADLAAEDLMKMYDNVNGPFMVWSEVAHGQGVPHFLTGMGGFLQTILSGYGGFRLTRYFLTIDPQLPPNTTSLHVTGLDYLHNSLDLTLTCTAVTLVVTSRPVDAPQLSVIIDTGPVLLMVDQPISFPPAKSYIVPQD